MVPFTEDMLADFNREGLDLKAHHILAHRDDINNLNAAFANIARRRRPRIVGEHYDDLHRDDLPIVVEETIPWVPSTDSDFGFGEIDLRLATGLESTESSRGISSGISFAGPASSSWVGSAEGP